MALGSFLGQLWANLQIQLNGIGSPSTVAQVHLRANQVPDLQDLKKALTLSFEKQQIVVLNYAKNANDPCPQFT